MSRTGRPPTTGSKLGLDDPLKSEFADYLAAKDDASIKTVVHRAIRAYMAADLKANPGFQERFDELQQARREARNGRNGLRVVKPDKGC